MQCIILCHERQEDGYCHKYNEECGGERSRWHGCLPCYACSDYNVCSEREKTEEERKWQTMN